MMDIKKYVIILGLIIVIFIGGVTMWYLKQQKQDTSNVTIENGTAIPTQTDHPQELSNEEASRLIDESLNKDSTVPKQTFGIVNIDSPQPSWFIVTCKVDGSQDGETKFVLLSNKNSDTPFTVIYNPYTMQSTVVDQLPEKVKNNLGDLQ